MTLPVEELEHVLKVAAEYKEETNDFRKADLVGINMEGPFISPAKKGAQDEKIFFLAVCKSVTGS